MDQNFGTPIPPVEEYLPEPKKKSNLVLIIVIVLLLVLCCCCMIMGGAFYWLWYNGDELFGIASLLSALPPVI